MGFLGKEDKRQRSDDQQERSRNADGTGPETTAIMIDPGRHSSPENVAERPQMVCIYNGKSVVPHIISVKVMRNSAAAYLTEV